MAYWDDVQNAIAAQSGGGQQPQEVTPPNLNWGVIGDIFNQTAQYVDDGYFPAQPDNLNWPDQQQQPQQQQPQDFGWFGNVMDAFNGAANYADNSTNGYQLNQPDLPPYQGPYTSENMPQAPDYQQGNPFDVVGKFLNNAATDLNGPQYNAPPSDPNDYFGNIYRGIKMPSEQNAVENNRQGKMPWDIAAEAAGNVVGGLLGGVGAAFQPLGGAVDKIADSGIPVVSQYGQGLRGYYENVAEPIFNFTPGIVGDVARGDPLNFLQNFNLFDDKTRQETVSNKLKYVQDAYDAAIANGYDDAGASKIAENLDRKLGNFANLTEYAGIQKFGTLPALAQLGIMLLDPVGNLGGEALLSGKLPSALTERGGRLGETAIGDFARNAENALGYATPLGQVGKAVGGVSKVGGIIGDATGIGGVFDRVGEAMQGGQAALNMFDVNSQEVIRELNKYADNNNISGRDVIGEYLNDPNSPVFSEAIGAPQELTDYLRQSYEYQPLPKDDPAITPQQQILDRGQSKLGVEEQVAGGTPETASTAPLGFNLDAAGPGDIPLPNRISNYIGDAVADKAEQLLAADPKLSRPEAAQLARTAPEIEDLRNNLKTEQDLADALRADADAKNVRPTVTPEMTAASDAAFDQIRNVPDRTAKPLPAKYTGVTLPPAKEAVVDEFFGTARQLKGVDAGAFKLDNSRAKPGLREVKGAENVPGIGKALQGWENLTHSVFARPFLNTWSRLVRDPASNIIKLAVHDPEALANVTMQWLSGGKDGTSRRYELLNGSDKVISTGPASASADVVMSQGAKGFGPTLWYYASNPANELTALPIRLLGKGMTRLPGKGAKAVGSKLAQFTQTTAIEAFEQGMKDKLAKVNFVREFDRQMRIERRSGTFEEMRKIPGFENLSDEALQNFIGGKMPKGVTIPDYIDNPLFTDKTLQDLDRVLGGTAGPIGDIIKQGYLDQLVDAIEAAKNDIMAKRDEEVHIASRMKDKKAGNTRASTALTQSETKLQELRLGVGPDHPVLKKLEEDTRKAIDNHFSATAAVAVADPAVTALARKVAQQQLDYAVKNTSYRVLRDNIESELRQRDVLSAQQRQAKEQPQQPKAQPANAAQKPAKTQGAAGLNDKQQTVLDWAENRYKKNDRTGITLKSRLQELDASDKGRALQLGYIRKWLNDEPLPRSMQGKRLMYEEGNGTYWLSPTHKKYNPEFEVPAGKQAAPSAPRETTVEPPKPEPSPLPTPPATVSDPAAIQARLQQYYDSFFKTGTAKPTYDFSATEMRRAASGNGLGAVRGKVLEADAKIREITGGRFKLDLDTMTPIGVPGSSFEGKYLTELVGKGAPRGKIEGPFPPKLPPEIKDMDAATALETVRQHYGDKALERIDPANLTPEQEAILNELSEAFLGVRAIDPLVGVHKATAEQTAAHAMMDEVVSDLETRYKENRSTNTVEREKVQGQQAEQQQAANSLSALRSRIAIKSHAAAYKGATEPFFDYRNKSTVDLALGSVLPYQYWARQNFAYAMRHFAAHPMHFAALLNFYKQLEEENNDPSIPDYAKGDIFLWQNSDGSKVLWDFSSVLPFNPFGSSDSVMQVVSPGDSTGRSTRNTSPLAVLVGTDVKSAAMGKVIGRDKGILPTFFRPNPILELAFKTGNVKNALQSLGIAKGDQSLLGQDYTEEARPQKETSGFVPGNAFYQEIGAATGLTKQLRGMGAVKGDLSPQSLVDEALFGRNAGKPLTKVVQELTSMTQKGEISPEQGQLAIAAFKEGNWTPEALKALDAVQGENAGRRLLTNIGFTTIVVNSPRQQLANTLYEGMDKAYDGTKAYTTVGEDGKTTYHPSEISQYYEAHPGASVLTSGNDSPDKIRQTLADDQTREAYSTLIEKSKAKQISSRDYNLGLARLQAANPQYFVDHPLKTTPQEQKYFEQLEQYGSIGGDKYDTLSKRAYDLSQSGDKNGASAIYNSADYRNAKISREQFMADNPDFKQTYVDYLKSKGQDYKEPDPKEQKYFDELAQYKSIGGPTYDAKAKAVSDAYASGNKTLGAKLYKDPEYLAYKTARDVFLKDHPDFKAQYDAYNKEQYGTEPKDIDLTGGNTTSSSSSSSTRLPAKKTTTTYYSAPKRTSTYVPYAQYKAQQASPAKAKAPTTATTRLPGTTTAAKTTAIPTAAGVKKYANVPAAKAADLSTRGWESVLLPADFGRDEQTPDWKFSGDAVTDAFAFNDQHPQSVAIAVYSSDRGGYFVYTKLKSELTKADLSLINSQNKRLGIPPSDIQIAPVATASSSSSIENTNTIANANSSGYTTSGSGAAGKPIYYRALQAAQKPPALTTRLPARRSGGGGRRSTRLPANAIRFSPGSKPRLPVRFG